MKIFFEKKQPLFDMAIIFEGMEDNKMEITKVEMQKTNQEKGQL